MKMQSPIPGESGCAGLEAHASVILRPFALSDLEQVLRIERASFPVDAYEEWQFVQLHSANPGEFFVADTGGGVVGYVTGSIKADCGELESIAVDSRFQGRGIGRMLTARILDRFRERGLKKCSLEVRTSNAEAIDLYQHLNFKIVGTLRAYYADGADAFLMEKLLR